MDARKVQLKYFIESPAKVDTARLVPVFHRWIQERALDELLIDVTEYDHVHEGPALLLVGHASDYAIDLGGGRAGLFYSRKRGAPEDAAACVLDAFRRVLFAAKKLEDEKSLSVPMRFRTDELVFRVNDRLRAPNTKESHAAAEPVLRDALAKVYPGSRVTLEQSGTPRDLLEIRVKASESAPVGELLKRIS
jgi:hypothetical protein